MGCLAVKTIKIPLKPPKQKSQISLVFEHFIDKMKNLDFSADFLSVIRNLVGMLF